MSIPLAGTTMERGEPGLPAPANRVFYPALDGFRALAFLMVFGQHYLQLFWGWTGVDFFFVLSGFLITGILYDTKDDPHHVWNFYIRRTLRIFPLYYGVFLLLLLLDPVAHWKWSWAWLLWPAYLGNYIRFFHPIVANTPYQMLSDAQPLSATYKGLQLYLGHFWSLCVEEQFYLVWPWIVFLVRDRRKLIAICTACVVVMPFLRVLATNYLPAFMVHQAVTYSATPFRADALLLGGLVALLLRAGYHDMLLRIARLSLVGCVVAIVVWLVLNPASRSWRLMQYPDWKYTWGLSFIDLFAASLIVMALEPRSWTYRAFMPAPLRWIGRVSYGAYILHDIPHKFYNLACKNIHNQSQVYVTSGLALTCTLIFAGLSFRYIESPFIQMKGRLSR